MGATRYEQIARVVKARGNEGKVTAKAADGLPCLLYGGLHVHVVPPALYGPRELTVSEVSELGNGGLVVGFEEFGSAAEAEGLAGRWLLADVEDLDFDWQEQPDFWLGRTVEDERFGLLGTIEEFIETPANEVWVVQGERGEVLVPAVEEFVLDVPEDVRRPVRTRIPDGLLEGE